MSTEANNMDKDYFYGQSSTGDGIQLQQDGSAPKHFKDSLEVGRLYSTGYSIDISYLITNDPDENQTTINTYLTNYNHVLINVSGEVLTRKITIPSNTHLELGVETILKLADNTADYLIVNSDTVGGNENIELSGGTLDQNKDNGNLKTGAWDVAYPGHSVFLWNVSGLKIHDQKHKGANKYCYLLTDVQNYTIDNINFLDTYSDGIHHLPPCSNGTITNIFGKTGDDMLAFTLGDYPDYQVTNTGDFENINCSYIYPDDAKAVVKITGSGAGSAYVHKNITVSNVKGTCQFSPISIIDDSVGGSNLLNTKCDNILFQDWNVSSTNSSTFCKYSSAVAGNFAIRELHMEYDGPILSVLKENGVVSLLNDFQLENVTFAEGLSITSDLVQIQPDCKISYPSIVGLVCESLSSGASIFNVSSGSSYTELIIDKTRCIGDSISTGIALVQLSSTSIAGGIQRLTNLSLDTMQYMCLNSNDSTVYLDNIKLNNIDKTHTASSVGTCRYIVGNLITDETTIDVSLGGTSVYSADGKMWKCNASLLTPLQDDIVTNTNGTLGTGAGVIIRNRSNTEWKNIYTGATA